MAGGTLKYAWSKSKMEQDKLHINYTAEDIQRYLGGKMPPLEMNALEKAALDDPFLAEAIEGYEQVPATDWKPSLQALKDGFAQGTAPAKVVQFTTKKYGWLKYAAAVLILGGGIGTYFMLNKGNSPQDDKTIAAAEKTTTPQTSGNVPMTDSALATNTGKQDENSLVKDKLLNNLKKDTQLVAINDKVAAGNRLLNPASYYDYDYDKRGETEQPIKEKQFPLVTAPAAAAKADDVAALADSMPVMDVASNTGRSAEARMDNFYNQEAILSNTQNRAKPVSQLEMNRKFFAQVVDANNNPLPFANINIKNEGFGTYADVKGNVRLVSADSIIPVEIKSLGFKSQTVLLRSNQQQNRIVLQEDATVAYRESNAPVRKKTATGVMSRRAMLERDSSLNAEPADGWDNYATYVGNNLELPDNILNKNLHGTVEVTFDVTSNGTISNVKVDKSLCDDCDEMAKRIVEQGPQWKIKKGRKAKARVKVNF
jgi:hypothetical protein